MASERIQRLIERLLDQIEEAMDRLDWESVKNWTWAVLALDANNNEAVDFLAAAERATGTTVTSASPSMQEPVGSPGI